MEHISLVASDVSEYKMALKHHLLILVAVE